MDSYTFPQTSHPSKRVKQQSKSEKPRCCILQVDHYLDHYKMVVAITVFNSNDTE